MSQFLNVNFRSLFLFLVLLIIGFIGLSFSWPSKLEQKIKASIVKTFNVENYGLIKINVNESTEEATTKKINECFFRVESDSNTIGFLYVGQAPSMKNVFDYAILFSPEMKIVNTKVLIYREKHGRQIGMKRWLKQFFGMTPDDLPVLGVQIDGISGATISTKSMTNSVREVLISINYLQEKNQI